MNITHAVSEEIVGDRLEAIFYRQKELMDKYHDIEKRSGLLQTEDCPVNIDDKRGQARIKDFSWRVTEELGEALDALAQNDIPHYCEELIDGLHFLTELTILAGYGPNDFVNKEDGKDLLQCIYDNNVSRTVKLESLIKTFVMDLGMMCNCLKNKAWKQTNMLTDKNHFKEQLTMVWCDYIAILSTELSSDEIADVYLKKSQVNKFRQRSNY